MADVRLQQQAKGERPQYFADPAVDRVLAITMALAGEVAVLADRLDTLERLLVAGTPITRDTLERFQPDAEVAAARDSWRARFLDVVLRSVHQEREQLERGAASQTYAGAIQLVENPDSADSQ